MPDIRKQESLKALICLSRVCECLAANGEITQTTLRNIHGFPEPLLGQAVELGVKKGVLKRAAYNYISLLESYAVQEEDYYLVVAEVIFELWKVERYSEAEFYIENTSRKDSKIVGPWTRPDFTLVSHKRFPWTIGTEFDVVTFEVKRPSSADVLAVFEALSHSSVATKAYVVFPLGHEAWVQANPEQAQRVKDECSRHGVGLIMIEDLTHKPKASHLIKAARRDISHEKCSNFLGAVVSKEGREKIAAWKT